MTEDHMRTPVMSAAHLSKTFGGRTVLHDASLEVMPSEIHGLVGQNGSGKSTLIKILAGIHAPDPGAELYVGDRQVALPLNETDPQKLGMGFVHQDLALAPQMTVLENLRVGSYHTRFGWRISWRSERRSARAALAQFGLGEVSPDAPVDSLPPIERALLAILRALERLKGFPHGLLVLDESTAFLPRDGVERVFQAMRNAARDGAGILFVTHRIEEIQAVSDRVTVLRDGLVVETARTDSLSERQLVEKIIGGSLGELYPAPHHAQRGAMLRISGLAGRWVNDFSLQAGAGEIIGLTGLLGMGQEEVPYLLFGEHRARSGSIEIEGNAWDLTTFSPAQAMKAGIILLPGNRLEQGGAGEATVMENVTLPTLPQYFRAGMLRTGEERRHVLQLLRQFGVAPPDPGSSFLRLSGGNQQKALIAKWFETQPKVMLLDEPTRGVDVGARREIFRHIRDAAERGKVILIASAEYEDLAHLCDRVVVFRNGRAVVEIGKGDLTKERIVEQCFLDVRGAFPSEVKDLRAS